jgi:hypothetical protein
VIDLITARATEVVLRTVRCFGVRPVQPRHLGQNADRATLGPGEEARNAMKTPFRRIGLAKSCRRQGETLEGGT